MGEASPWSAEGLGRGHAKSTALKAASSEANSDPPYKEAYWYGRDTENRLANQLATVTAAVQASVKESKDLAKETSKESKETAKESKELVGKSVERSNLIIFLGFVSLAVLVSMQPELRVFFSLFLSKLK